MQVHVMCVREYQFDQSQGITVSRFLPNNQISSTELLKDFVVYCACSENGPVWPGDLVVVLGEVATIALNSRHYLGALNSGRHVPVRTKYHILHFVLKN